MQLPIFYIDDIIKIALKEDINYIDISTDLLIDPSSPAKAQFMAKADGVLCGIDVAMRVFELIDPNFAAVVLMHDGDTVKSGDIIAEFSGTARGLLNGERTALNLIQHMSGIASATAKCVDIIKGTGASIVDTRKTLPGLRAIQKYAVMTGGGRNHRFNLSDAAMLKDNHIDAAGGIPAAVSAIRGKLGHMVKLEVETRTFDEVRQAADSGADVIMLDNMDCDTMREAVRIIDGRALTEASGGITADSLLSVAQTGVDVISLGALTHSVTALDISMNFIGER